jgi:hypothetical protein
MRMPSEHADYLAKYPKSGPNASNGGDSGRASVPAEWTKVKEVIRETPFIRFTNRKNGSVEREAGILRKNGNGATCDSDYREWLGGGEGRMGCLIRRRGSIELA